MTKPPSPLRPRRRLPLAPAAGALLLLPLALTLILGAAPAGAGGGSDGGGAGALEEVLDLSETAPAGQFRAYRVELEGDGRLQAGGVFRGVVTEQPMLPLIVVVEKDGAPYAVANKFGYDVVTPNNPLEYGAWLRTPLVDVTQAESEIRGGGWTTWPAPAGTYTVVIAWGPGNGEVDVRLQFLDAPVRVLASDAGRSFHTRGLDTSETGHDVFLWWVNGYARSWRYADAEATFEVQGRMFAFSGIVSGTGTHWQGPDGSAFPTYVVGGGPGAWKAVFPEASFLGPVCVRFCLVGDGTIENPPFAIAADVRI